MEDQHVKIKDIRDVAEHALAFVVDKPEGFDFQPGQHGLWEFEEDGEKSRPFTIAASPSEPNLAFATVIRDESDFKQTLKNKRIGDELVFSGPYGDFTYTGKDKHAVFVAGGIGITPFISMLRYADTNDIDGRITVLHSCKSVERTPFKHELVDLVGRNDNMDIAFTLTDQEWDGPTGRIDADFIRQFVREPQQASWYVAGPPEMVKDIETLLKEEIQAENVWLDEFEGY